MPVSTEIPRGRFSEQHFVGDLANLFRRHKVPCGAPENLDQLADHLQANQPLQIDLFTLCTAISHMGAEDLTAKQMMSLVARAVGGPGVSERESAMHPIPPGFRTAFLNSYEAWLKRRAESDPFLVWSHRPVQQSPSVEPPVPVTAPAAVEQPAEIVIAPAPVVSDAVPDPPVETPLTVAESLPVEDRPLTATASEPLVTPLAPVATVAALPKLSFSAYPERGDPRIRRLRVTVVVLGILLAAACAALGVLAYRYVQLVRTVDTRR